MTAEPSAIAATLGGDRRRQRREVFWRLLFLGAAATSILITIAIVVSLGGEAWVFISNVDLSSLWEIGWFPRRGMFDIRTIVVGTLLVAGIAMLVATPLGLGYVVRVQVACREFPALRATPGSPVSTPVRTAMVSSGYSEMGMARW